MKSVISDKRMIEMYLQSGCSDDTWNMFREMCLHNLITIDAWKQFSFRACGWYLPYAEEVRDADNGDKLIAIYDGNKYKLV